MVIAKSKINHLWSRLDQENEAHRVWVHAVWKFPRTWKLNLRLAETKPGKNYRGAALNVVHKLTEYLSLFCCFFLKDLKPKKKYQIKKKNRATCLTEAFVLEQVKFKFLVLELSMGLGKEDYLNCLFFGQSQSLHFDAEISLRKYEKWRFISSEFFLLTCPSECYNQSGSSLKM